MSRLRRVKVDNGSIKASDLGEDVILKGDGEGDIQGYGYLSNDEAVSAKAGKTLKVGSPEWKARAERTAEAIKNGELDLKNIHDPDMYNYVQGKLGPGGEYTVREGDKDRVKVALGALSIPGTIIGAAEMSPWLLAHAGELIGGTVGGTLGDKATNALARLPQKQVGTDEFGRPIYESKYEGWGDMISSTNDKWHNAYQNNGLVKMATDMTNPGAWVGGAYGASQGNIAQDLFLARRAAAKGIATAEQKALIEANQGMLNSGPAPLKNPLKNGSKSTTISSETIETPQGSKPIEAIVQEKAFRKGVEPDLNNITTSAEALAPGGEGSIHLLSKKDILEDMPHGEAVKTLSKDVHDKIFDIRHSDDYIISEADRLLSHGKGLETNAPLLWQQARNGDEVAVKTIENLKKAAEGKLIVPGENTGRILQKGNPIIDIHGNPISPTGEEVIFPVVNKEGYAISPLQGIEATTKFGKVYDNGNRFIPNITAGLKGVENGSVLDLAVSGGSRSAKYDRFEKWAAQYLANDAPSAAFYGKDGTIGDISKFEKYLKSLGWNDSAIKEALEQKEIIRSLMTEANWGYKPRVDGPVMYDAAHPDPIFSKSVMPSRLMFPGSLKTGEINPELFQKRLDFDTALTRLGGMTKQYNTRGVVEMYGKTPQLNVPKLDYRGDWWKSKLLDGETRRYNYSDIPASWRKKLMDEKNIRDFTQGSLYDYPTFIKNGGNKNFKFFENGDQFAHYVGPDDMAIIKRIRDVPYGAEINDIIMGTNLVNLKKGGVLKRVQKAFDGAKIKGNANKAIDIIGEAAHYLPQTSTAADVADIVQDITSKQSPAADIAGASGNLSFKKLFNLKDGFSFKDGLGLAGGAVGLADDLKNSYKIAKDIVTVPAEEYESQSSMAPLLQPLPTGAVGKTVAKIFPTLRKR